MPWNAQNFAPLLWTELEDEVEGLDERKGILLLKCGWFPQKSVLFANPTFPIRETSDPTPEPHKSSIMQP